MVRARPELSSGAPGPWSFPPGWHLSSGPERLSAPSATHTQQTYTIHSDSEHCCLDSRSVGRRHSLPGRLERLHTFQWVHGPPASLGRSLPCPGWILLAWDKHILHSLQLEFPLGPYLHTQPPTQPAEARRPISPREVRYLRPFRGKEQQVIGRGGQIPGSWEPSLTVVLTLRP